MNLLDKIKNVDKLNGKTVYHFPTGIDIDFSRSQHVIGINHEANTVMFKLKDNELPWPSNEKGEITDLLRIASRLIHMNNQENSNPEDRKALSLLESAIYWQDRKSSGGMNGQN